MDDKEEYINNYLKAKAEGKVKREVPIDYQPAENLKMKRKEKE